MAVLVTILVVVGLKGVKKKIQDIRMIDEFKSRLSLIVRVNVVLSRTVVVDSD